MGRDEESYAFVDGAELDEIMERREEIAEESAAEIELEGWIKDRLDDYDLSDGR